MKEYQPCTCQKDRFMTRREAKRQAKKLTRKYRFPYGVYRCGTFWHVTSYGEYRKMKRREYAKQTGTQQRVASPRQKR